MNYFKNNCIYYKPSQVRNLLSKSINHKLDNIQCYVNDPVSDFSRNRILNARTVIDMILNFSNHSSNNELCYYFGNSDLPAPTPSAFSQARRKLNPEIFKSINDSFIRSIQNFSTLKGYYLLAQDGSGINIPYLDDETAVQNRDNKPFCQLHLNALYDCINHVYWDYNINHYNKKQEINALIDIIHRKNYPSNSIIIADRGYESYNLIAHCNEENQKFIIRVKDVDSYGILKTLNLPDEEFDITISKILTNIQTNEIKKIANTYFFLLILILIFWMQ